MRFGLVAGTKTSPDGNHGLAFGIEPGEFIQGPDVAPLEGQFTSQAKIVAVQAAWHGLQQTRGVLADVG